MPQPLPCFRMKPSQTGSEIVDLVVTREAVAKLSALSPAVILGVESWPCSGSQASESGLMFVRLAVVPTEMFQDPDYKPEQESDHVQEILPDLDEPILDRLRKHGFIE